MVLEAKFFLPNPKVDLRMPCRSHSFLTASPCLQGVELVPQLTSGDVIVSAELVSGKSRLTNALTKAA